MPAERGWGQTRVKQQQNNEAVFLVAFVFRLPFALGLRGRVYSLGPESYTLKTT